MPFNPTVGCILPCCSGVPLGVELEMSPFADVVTLLVVAVLPAVVDVDSITWVVSVGPYTVQVYKQSM